MDVKVLGTLAALVMVMSGCSGHMNVTVKVANPEMVRSIAVEQSRRVECLVLISKSDSEIANEIRQSYLSPVQAAMKELQANMLAVAAQPVSCPKNNGQMQLVEVQRSTLRSIANDLPTSMESLETESKLAETVKASAHVRNLLNSLSPEKICDMHNIEVVRSVSNHRSIIEKHKADLLVFLNDTLAMNDNWASEAEKCDKKTSDSVAKESDASAKAIIAEATANIQSACKSLICDGGLATSEYAYALTALPKEEWKDKFNRASAVGINGNVDIVIKMTERADFTVKGMRFDASKVSEMARKATTQGILLAASISGVPISVPSQNSPDNKGAAQASNALSATLDKQVKREALLEQRRQALLRLGLLVASGSSLLSTADGREQMKSSLQAQVNALNTLLNLNDYPK